MGMLAEKQSKSLTKGTKTATESHHASTFSPCNNCSVTSKCRKRTFSEQAWTVLLLWEEISPNAVDQAICEDCYAEMREVLIERSDEVEVAMGQRDQVAKIKSRLGKLAG